MTLLSASLIVAGLSWIITREELFAPLRAKAISRWAYPLTCMYCLAPWVGLVVVPLTGLSWVWWPAVVWLAYWQLALYAKVRG